MSKNGNADELLELARGFQPASVLVAAAELELFDALGESDQPAEVVAAQVGTDLRATTMLLDALAALGIIEKHGNEYHLPAGTAPMLASKSSETIVPMLQHQANCLQRWAQLSRVVKSGRPAERQPSIRGQAGDDAAFIGAMDVVSGPVAAALIAELPLPPFRHLLDVGGASGTWTIAFLKSHPEATATLFDLPHVIPMAEARLAAAGVKDRVRLVAGDFYHDPLPTGTDLVWLSAIVHQNSREQNVRLFASIARALDEEGHLLIRDMLMDDARTRPVAGALFAINMLVHTEAGGTFTFEELRDDLQAAGLMDAAVLRRDEGMHSVVAARKAS